MDLENLRFSYEEDMLRLLVRRFGPVPLRNYHEAQNLLQSRKQGLLGDAVRITADLLPDIHKVYRRCLDIIGGDISGDLFVQQSKEYNASVFANEGQFDLLLHSEMLNDFSPEELSFVIGHELGHVVFDHSQFPVHDILANAKGVEPGVATLLLRWARASEVSADRVGLLCCGQLSTAVTALFRTSSGLSGLNVDKMLQSFRKQYEDLEAHIRENRSGGGWVRTHPMMPIRFKALELAALDIIALGQGSRGFSWKGFRSIDRQISFILESLDRQSEL